MKENAPYCGLVPTAESQPFWYWVQRFKCFPLGAWHFHWEFRPCNCMSGWADRCG